MTIGLNLALGITMRESMGNANNKIYFFVHFVAVFSDFIAEP